MSPNGCPVEQDEKIESREKKLDIKEKDEIDTIRIDDT